MLNIPSFAQTYGAMQNRMKAQLEGKVPQGYHSDYEWGQFGKQIDAENREAAQQAEQDKERARQQPPPMSFNQMQQLQSNQLSQLRPDGFGQGGPLGFANGGLVPPMIKAANPEAYYDHRTGTTVIGDFSGSTKRARGFTWSGNAIKGGQVFQGTGGKFGMPGPDERRAPIGGRATPPAPDMFGRQFGGADPFRTVYKGKFAEGGLVPNPGGLWHGPGGPKDDEIHAKVSPGEFEMPFEAVMFHGTKKLRTMIDEARESGDTMKAMPKSKGTPPPMGMPAFANGGVVVPPSIYRAMADQDVAAEANYISPTAIIPTQGGGRFNRAGGANTGWESEGMGHYLFPQPGIDASQRAQASIGRAIADIGQFMDAQPAIDARFDAQTARRRSMLDSLNDPAAVARMSAASPNPFLPTAEDQAGANRAVNGAVDTGMAYAPNMNDHPAFNAPDPQTLADMRARRAAIRAADMIPGMIPPTMEPQPMTAEFAPRMTGRPASGPMPSTPFLSPSEKDAARAAAADAASGRPEGVRKSDWRKFQRTPQGMMFGINRQDQQAAEMKQDARTAVKDQQDMADRNLRIAEFQQNQERYQKAAEAGDREAQLRLAQFNLDVSKTQMDEARRNKAPELRAVPTPDGNGVVYFNGNQMASGVMPAKGKEEAAVLTREQMDALDVDVDRVVDGKISYKKRAQPSPSIRDDGFVAFFRYENGKMVEVPQVMTRTAPAAQAPSQNNAPPATSSDSISKADYEKLKPGETYLWKGQKLIKK